VYLYDFSSGKTEPLSDDATLQSQPVISGDLVASVETSSDTRSIIRHNLFTQARLIR